MSGGAYPEGRPVIADSARKHRVPDADILHAYRHRIQGQEARRGMRMISGFSRDMQLLKIGYDFEDGQTVIRHVMPARDQFIPKPRRRKKRR